MARVRCKCGRLATSLTACKLCGSDDPMRHWHKSPDEVHNHPHDGEGHDHTVTEPQARLLEFLEKEGKSSVRVISYGLYSLGNGGSAMGPTRKVLDRLERKGLVQKLQTATTRVSDWHGPLYDRTEIPWERA